MKAAILAILPLSSLGLAAVLSRRRIGGGIGAIGAIGAGLSGQSGSDCRTWTNGCAEPTCPQHQVYVRGYCVDSSAPQISCVIGQMYDTVNRKCVPIPAGRPGSTIDPCQDGFTWIRTCKGCGTYGPDDGYCLSDECPSYCNGECDERGMCAWWWG